ncbi:EAL domain-containing protein [[Eubacterium] hominis]|uniref:bifunctional diguanylate cyclase/phosphodiesterase n=1 Tax=[Eubacterium] hominis TaxID=2764325 RepID=UPI003A4D5974
MDKQIDLFEDFKIDPYLFYDAMVNSTDDYIYIVDMQKDISLISENMLRDFDLPGRFVDGLVPLWGTLILEKDKQRYFDSINEMMDGKTDEHNVEYQIRNRQNEYVWVSCRGLLKRDEQGVPIVFAGIVTNLGSKGKIDSITGLFTQSECTKYVSQYLEDKNASGGIMLLGLDDFSRINALNDHIFGNVVLRQFAQTVIRLLPDSAMMYRFDGDEFAIVYKGATKEMVYELYQKLHAYCNTRHSADGTPYYCTASAGIAMINEDGDNYLDLIKYAAGALEASKHKGKNTFTFFSLDLIESKLRSMKLSEHLQNAILNDMQDFEMYYQPLLNTSTMKVKGAEALLRWKCDYFGNVSPAEFIPLMESSGLMTLAGRWILETAVATCKEWITYIPDFVMNINISYLQMLDHHFIDHVKSVLEKHQLDPKHIVLELTESYFVTDMVALKDTFDQLRAMNIKIAMDDFGTGYSSLGMLAQTPADIVKIDRLFISAINANKFNLDFISAVISLCHSIGIKVTVEGVEHRSEMDIVLHVGADCIQGFFVSKPVPKKKFEEAFMDITNVQKA